MDNFRQYRPPRRQAASAVDGFVSRHNYRGATHRRGAVSNSNHTPQTVGIADFKQPEGFHAQQRQQLAHPDIRQTNHTQRGVHGSPNPAIGDFPAANQELQPAALIRKKRLRSKKKYSGRKIAVRLFASVLIFGLLGGGFFASRAYFAARNVLQGGGDAPALAKTIDVTKLKGEGDGRVNVLLLGVGGAGHDGADLTDTIILASIDPINKKTVLLSVPRDLWVEMPNNYFASEQKINAAYSSGKYLELGFQDASNADIAAVRAGFGALDGVIEDVLGVPIHYNVLVNFNAFAQAIDTVGGVSINVPEALVDPSMAWENGWNPILAPEGPQTMDGDKALMYVRSRKTSSDFARSERQRSVMVALKDKVFTLGTLSNPSKISDLISAFGDNVVSDLSVGDAARMAELMKEIPNDQIQSVGLTDQSVNLLTTGTINGLSAVQPRAGVFQYDDIRVFTRTVLKDGFIEKENATIAIYNGTLQPGMAGEKAKDLQSYGYNITTVANAPNQNYQKTVIVDLSNGTKQVTTRYLEQRYGVEVVTENPEASIPTTDVDFVIILGEDAKTIN